MTKNGTEPSAGAARRRITLERTYQAPVEDVWELWTTKEGIESWWGPDGFAVKVRKLDLRPGGELLYAMTAIAPAQVAFMKQAGMPLTTEAQITYAEILAPRRLAYTHRADFIPGVEPYDVGDEGRAVSERAGREDGPLLRPDARQAMDAAGGPGLGERARQAREGAREKSAIVGPGRSSRLGPTGCRASLVEGSMTTQS
jgi:hypothetical protein